MYLVYIEYEGRNVYENEDDGGKDDEGEDDGTEKPLDEQDVVQVDILTGPVQR